MVYTERNYHFLFKVYPVIFGRMHTLIWQIINCVYTIWEFKWAKVFIILCLNKILHKALDHNPYINQANHICPFNLLIIHILSFAILMYGTFYFIGKF